MERKPRGKPGEKEEQEEKKDEGQAFQFIKLSVLREYLYLEFKHI